MRTVVTLVFASALGAALSACATVERNFDGSGGSGGGSGGSTTTTSSSSSTGGAQCVTDADCDDEDVCTTDTCDAGACAHAAVAMDDGDACTVDTCDPMTGVAHAPLDFDDHDVCTIDACDPVTGPSHTPVTIDDGDACTADTCDPVTGPSHAPVTIDDGDACTADTCDSILGVTHDPIFEPEKFAITELNIGDPDYAVLTNTSTCPNSTAGFLFVWDSSNGADVATVLPTQIVPPMGTLEITDAPNPPAPKIYAGAAVNFDPSGGGAALLCNGTCNPTSVIDAVTFSIGAAAPVLPPGITFTPQALRGITIANQNAVSFHRTSFGGVAPAFVTSDWTTGEPCDIKNLKIVELNIGPDFLVIHNPTICKLSLNGLSVLLDDSSAPDVTVTLPNQLIGAGGTVRLTKSPSLPEDIPLTNMPFTAQRGGNALLCNGACTTAANVIDAVSFDAGAPHPPLPTGVTFAPTGISGITTTTETARSFVRVAQTGVAPAFVRTDWSTGPLCTDQTKLRFGELNIGSTDYIRIDNPSYCTITLAGLQIFFDDSSTGDSTAVLPPVKLAPLSRAFAKETAMVLLGDIDAGPNIPYSSTRGGAAMLCIGPCSTTSGANVIDVVAFSTGAPFPPLPPPLNFTPALLGIDPATENTKVWLRGAYKGLNPGFLGSDWFVGPPSL